MDNIKIYGTQKRLFCIFAGKAAFEFEKREKNLSVEILEKKLCTFNKKSSVFKHGRIFLMRTTVKCFYLLLKAKFIHEKIRANSPDTDKIYSQYTYFE